MNNSMVAHLWANEMKEFANGSNFYFEGESIYSYGGILRSEESCETSVEKRRI